MSTTLKTLTNGVEDICNTRLWGYQEALLWVVLEIKVTRQKREQHCDILYKDLPCEPLGCHSVSFKCPCLPLAVF